MNSRGKKLGLVMATVIAAFAVLAFMDFGEDLGASLQPDPGRDSGHAGREANLQAPDQGRRDLLIPALEEKGAAPLDQEPSGDASKDFGILVQFIDYDKGQVVGGIPVLAFPADQRAPQRVPTSTLNFATDAQGIVFLDHLDGPGPWNIHALPFQPIEGGVKLPYRGCTGTLKALPILGRSREEFGSSAGLKILQVHMGASVILRSPLPVGIGPEDLLFELRGTASALSSQMGGLTRFAKGFEGPDGYVRARFRRLSNGVRGEGFSIHVVTANGLFALSVRREGHAHSGTAVEIDEGFEPRGVVRVELGSSDSSRPLPEGRAFVRAMNEVKMSGGGSGSLGLGFSRSALIGRRVRNSGPFFEIHGLPLAPFDIGAADFGHYGQVGLDYFDYNSSGDSIHWRPVSTQRVIPNHGLATPVSILLESYKYP